MKKFTVRLLVQFANLFWAGFVSLNLYEWHGKEFIGWEINFFQMTGFMILVAMFTTGIYSSLNYAIITIHLIDKEKLSESEEIALKNMPSLWLFILNTSFLFFGFIIHVLEGGI